MFKDLRVQIERALEHQGSVFVILPGKIRSPEITVDRTRLRSKTQGLLVIVDCAPVALTRIFDRAEVVDRFRVRRIELYSALIVFLGCHKIQHLVIPDTRLVHQYRRVGGTFFINFDRFPEHLASHKDIAAHLRSDQYPGRLGTGGSITGRCRRNAKTLLARARQMKGKTRD